MLYSKNLRMQRIIIKEFRIVSYQSGLEHRRKTQKRGFTWISKVRVVCLFLWFFLMGSKKNIRRPGLMLKTEAFRDTGKGGILE